MQMIQRVLVLLLLTGGSLAIGPGSVAAKEPRATYPETRRSDAVDRLHGHEIPDPYRWLEPDDDPEVEAWDNAQQALLEAYMEALPRRDELRARIARELDTEGMPSLPTFRGMRRFYTFREKGRNHAALYVGSSDGDGGRIVLDPNTWSEDGTEGMNGWEASPGGSFVAYLRDSKGSEANTLYVRDVVTGEDLEDVITRTKFTSIAWAPDESGFLYSRLPDPESVPAGEEQYHRRIFWHELGTLPSDDVLVAWRHRPLIEWPHVWTSSDGQYVFAGRERTDQNWDSFEAVWGDGGLRLDPLIVGHDSRTSVDRTGDVYVLLTDWNAPEKAVYTATRVTIGDPEAWTLVVPPGDGVLEDIRLVGDRMIVHVKRDLVSHLAVYALDGTHLGDVELPAQGTVTGLAVREGDGRIWFTFDSYHLPPTNYVAEVAPRIGAPTALESVATTIDVSELTTTRSSYPSKDGTRIPIWFLHRKDVELDGSAPTILYGYGGFRVGLAPRFARSRALWAELGGVYAIANLRGGDEFGEAWHEAGMLGNKQNVYDDFIAAADWLVERGMARRDRLAIEGCSNGGLLVAVCANQRPDLCRAVVCSVPLTDMLRFHRFQYARSWTKEYGDPDDPKAFEWIRAYSPYHNVREGAAYPAALVVAGLADGRVNAFHARKIAARWQAATSSSRPILLAIDRDSGHGAASLKQYEGQLLDKFSFLLNELAD